MQYLIDWTGCIDSSHEFGMCICRNFNSENLEKTWNHTLLKYNKIDSGGSVIRGASSIFLPCSLEDTPSEEWIFLGVCLAVSARGRRKL